MNLTILFVRLRGTAQEYLFDSYQSLTSTQRRKNFRQKLYEIMSQSNFLLITLNNFMFSAVVFLGTPNLRIVWN